MEAEPPAWLNKEFLTTALQEGDTGKHDLEVTNFSVKLAVAPGNNYTSRVYRVNVEYQDDSSSDLKTISLIVKAPIHTGAIGEFSAKIDMFSTEPKIYKTVLPVLSEIAEYKFGPKLFLSTEINSLVLKDLKPDGYVVCDRFQQLDIRHCRKVIHYLAKFHAASVAFHHKNSDLVESFKEPMYMKDGPVVDEMKEFIVPSLKVFLNLINENHQTLKQYLTEKLDTVWDSVVEFCTPKSNHLNVLNHGDCWTNNLLFKYDDKGDIEDVKFIDYQLVRFSSPVMDLIYFIWASGNEDVRDHYQEELYDLYLKTLNRTLDELNCEESLSQEELDAILKSASEWILMNVGFVLPFIVNDPDNVVDLGIIDSQDVKSNKLEHQFTAMYQGKRYQFLLPGYLRQFERFVTSH